MQLRAFTLGCIGVVATETAGHMNKIVAILRALPRAFREACKKFVSELSKKPLNKLPEFKGRKFRNKA